MSAPQRRLIGQYPNKGKMAGCILVRNCRKWSLFAGTAVFTAVIFPVFLLYWLKIAGVIRTPLLLMEP
jgi:hypothetical protein